ncbi:MAG: hypothetical protein U0X20_00575 [Caldilineaceae bacterium]
MPDPLVSTKWLGQLANQIVGKQGLGRVVTQSRLQPSVHFTLEIVSPSSSSPCHELLAGATYEVHIYASPNFNAETNSIAMERSSICLELQAHPESIVIGEPVANLSKNSLDGVVHRTAVTLEHGCMHKEARFTLLAKRTDVDDKLRPVASLVLAIRPDVDELEKGFLEQVHISPAMPLPNHIAVLHVERNEQGNWVLEGWNGRRKSLSRTIVSQPQHLSATWLEDLPDNEISNVWGQFRAWSSSSIGALQQWLHSMLLSYGDSLVLAVVNREDADFPWELVHVYDDDTQVEFPIGARVSIVRWMRFDWYHRKVYLELHNGESQACRGWVTAYLDNSLPGISFERSALAQVHAHEHASLKDLYDALKTGSEAPDASLILVACHGDCPREWANGSWGPITDVLLVTNDRSETLSYTHLSRIPFIGDLARRPLVFLNACHSARLISRGSGNGLAVPLLQRIARGFIGTIGRVDSHYAGELAAQLLYTAAKTEGVQVAWFLREVRAKAFDMWVNNPLDDRPIYAFFYTYLGNPYLRLHLTPIPAPPTTEDIEAL